MSARRVSASHHALVVDDDVFSREFAATLLQQAGFSEVQVAADGVQALALVAAREPALILCDLIMPRIDGIELMRRLGDMGCRSAIVLVSGLDSRLLSAAARVATARGLNVLGYLGKPMAVDRLQHMLAAGVRPDGVVAPEGPAIGHEELLVGLQNGEITAHFQPKFRVADGALVGVEALARWRNALLGEVSPAVFVPAAERHGLIHRLTATVLSQSLAWLQGLGVRGEELSVSVNLSMDDLQGIDFTPRVLDLIGRYGIEPKRVVFEVTESQLMREPSVALEILTQLRLRGFRLSIDDFGTGWSSLEQLRQIPFEELKLDARFVSASPADEAALAIVESSTALAKRLRMGVVAEGVERVAHWDLCRQFGIDQAQGFLLGRATSGRSLEANCLED
jgi:EAL domain-containing protein (putative c-di-GMP-specific phosphodiesterase class I)/CheY-like chemotaxis protein